ncbi:MAG: PD-(D/E)XK nuclease family protein [Geodermatophilaceae bacterium]|nr:PD-(D/E)XK nuclease family protein [Geodermatophilaceae bacterium]
MPTQTAPFPAESRTRSLSPSRAADFKTCPLLYRLRTIDRLPQRPSAAATRGTLVHAVLERLYDLPADGRTPNAARAMVAAEWAGLLETEPDLQQIVTELRDLASAASAPDSDTAGAEITPVPEIDPGADGDVIGRWLVSAGNLLDSYFALEDPTRIQPVGRELMVEFDLGDGPVLRGIIDRLDATADGDLRVVDYKTGVAPREAYEAKALFQMKFYALVLYRTSGVVPRQLRLIYLGDKDMLSYAPEAEELDRFERTLRAIWAAIQASIDKKEFRASPSRLCTWCDYQDLCPAWGGTPPPYPEAAVPVDDPADEPD